MTSPLVIGIDIGTSGVRAVVLDDQKNQLYQYSTLMSKHGHNHRDPTLWWRATEAVLHALLARIDPDRVVALSVDGTSGTVLAIDAEGEPLGDALMYNDPVAEPDILSTIAALAPRESAAHGATSGLAKVLFLEARLRPTRLLHQADWIAGRLSGRFDLSDANNALKTGYDPVAERWPDWIAGTGARIELLPRVMSPGTPSGTISGPTAARFGLDRDTMVVAGTTDGCASFLATGAALPGEAVTALGTSLTLKILTSAPIFAPDFGIYSHRIGDSWLAGGASNTGGGVLAQFFSPDQIEDLSSRIDPDRPSGLDYYPLPGRGERFPIADPRLISRISPRPRDDVTFLQALMEGIADIEALGYSRLMELGAPAPRSLRSVGGGSRNPAWTRMRQDRLRVPFLATDSEEAAAGAATLALRGARIAGRL